MKKQTISQKDLLIEFFKKHPNRDISHPEVVDLLIPEIQEPESVKNVDSSDCQFACANYVVKCLTLVPNASKDLLDEGLNSCMSECQRWNSQKTGCMIEAIDCESMTNVCGL